MHHIGDPAHIIADPGQQGRLADRIADLKGVTLDYEAMDCGHFQVGGGVVVEYKSGTDFILSVVEKELFETANRLRAHHDRPVFLVEGDYFTARFHQTPFDIHWAIGYLTSVLNIPVLYSPDGESSAVMVYTLAVSAQQDMASGETLRIGQPDTRREAIRFLVEGLPGVDPDLARNLLRHFGTARAVFAAGRDELLAVEGMTEKTAGRISDVLDSKKGK
ncbi:MAG TPA: ERCC4 domain-containing protein [Gammaproteobacteria bacterium]|nr:ERCC4 domain-containing protein [Gammaproteobacteria bacterium]